MRIGQLVKWKGQGQDREWRGIVVAKVCNSNPFLEGRYRILGLYDHLWYELHKSSKYVEVISGNR